VAVALLGSYAAQSQLGDHNPDTHGNTSDYLKGLELSLHQNDELLDRISELHRTHRLGRHLFKSFVICQLMAIESDHLLYTVVCSCM